MCLIPELHMSSSKSFCPILDAKVCDGPSKKALVHSPMLIIIPSYVNLLTHSREFTKY